MEKWSNERRNNANLGNKAVDCKPNKQMLQKYKKKNHRVHAQSPQLLQRKKSGKLSGGNLVARNRGIRRHRHHAACPAAHVLFAFNVPIIRVEEFKGGPGAESATTLNGPHCESLATGCVIDGDGAAIERAVGAGHDALEVLRHSSGVRKGEVRLCAGSSRHTFHHEGVARVHHVANLLGARRGAMGSVDAGIAALNLQRGTGSGRRCRRNDGHYGSPSALIWWRHWNRRGHRGCRFSVLCRGGIH